MMALLKAVPFQSMVALCCPGQIPSLSYFCQSVKDANIYKLFKTCPENAGSSTSPFWQHLDPKNSEEEKLALLGLIEAKDDFVYAIVYIKGLINIIEEGNGYPALPRI